jgi:CheY-like chemotaxis protein
MVAEILAGHGYDVEQAGSGEACLAAVRASAPDVLVLDLLLPGMDGGAVLEELRSAAALARTRVVVMTAVRTGHIRRLLRPDAVLFKPFGVDELLHAIGVPRDRSRR